MNAQVINVSAPNEIVIDKGSNDFSVNQNVVLYSILDNKVFSKGAGVVTITHKSVSVIRSEDFIEPKVGDFIK